MPEIRKSFQAALLKLSAACTCVPLNGTWRTFATILFMNFQRIKPLVPLVLFILISPLLFRIHAHEKARSATAKTNAATSIAAPLGVAPDIDARLAKFKPIEMPLNRAGLSEREQKLVEKLVDAANCIEQIYWRQSDPEGLKLYVRLEKSQDPLDQKVLRLMTINGSRYDLIDQLRPFSGNEPAPPGHALYPNDLLKADLAQYVVAHPEQKEAIYNEQSILMHDGNRLQAVPYHVTFAEYLKPAAEDLREAAKLSDDPQFAKFLNMRADALLND